MPKKKLLPLNGRKPRCVDASRRFVRDPGQKDQPAWFNFEPRFFYPLSREGV